MLPKEKLVRKIVILGLSLIIVTVGFSAVIKKTHFTSKVNKITGQIAGVASYAGRFLDSISWPTSAAVASPYQSVDGDVAMSGKVGIGIGAGSPNDTLAVNGTIGMLGTGTGTYNRAVIYNDLTNNWLFERARTTDASNGTITDFIVSQRGGGTPGLIVKGNGNVGIGTASPGQKLTIAGGTRFAYYADPPTYHLDLVPESPWANDVDYVFRLTDYGGPQNAVVMRIAGQTGAVTISNLTTQGYVCTSSAGLLSAGGASCSTSDARLKTNIADISSQTDVLSALDKLHGVYFNWDLANPANAGQSPKRQVGMVAQDMEKVLPELVSYGSDGYRRLDYAKFTGYLVEVAKAQQKQITPLLSIIDIVNKIGHFVQIETQKLIVSGVDILEKLNTLSQKVDAQQREIDSLKQEIQLLKQNR